MSPRDFIDALDRMEQMSPSDRARTRFDFAGAALDHQSVRIRERPVYDLDFRGTRRDAIAAVGNTTGLLLQIGPDLGDALDAEIEIAARRATPLALVDHLGLGWKHDRYGLVLGAPAAIARPTTYAGPFRVQLLALQTRRETDFAGGNRLEVDAQVAIDFEWPIRPLGPPSLRLLDDQHSAAENDADNRWRWRCATRTRALPPETRALASIDGDVMCTFPESYREVAIDDLGDAATAAVGDLELAVERRADDRVLLHVTASGDAARLPRAMVQSLAPTAILGIDDAGDHRLATVSLMHSFGGTGAPSAVRVGAAFGGDGFGRLRSLRLRLATGAIHQLHPLRLADVELP